MREVLRLMFRLCKNLTVFWFSWKLFGVNNSSTRNKTTEWLSVCVWASVRYTQRWLFLFFFLEPRAETLFDCWCWQFDSLWQKYLPPSSPVLSHLLHSLVMWQSFCSLPLAECMTAEFVRVKFKLGFGGSLKTFNQWQRMSLLTGRTTRREEINPAGFSKLNWRLCKTFLILHRTLLPATEWKYDVKSAGTTWPRNIFSTSRLYTTIITEDIMNKINLSWTRISFRKKLDG